MYNSGCGGYARRDGHGFSVWPLILLALFAFVFAGPMLHIAFFFVNIAFGLLPFALVFGLGALFASRWWGHSGHMGEWHKRKFDSFHNAEKRKHDAADGNSEIFYV